jgi:hypothetical protein
MDAANALASVFSSLGNRTGTKYRQLWMIQAVYRAWAALRSPEGAERERAEPWSDQRGRWAAAFVLSLGCFLLWHAHGIQSGYFQNLDVAGIVYNARILLSGRVPYVDSVEIKPPGAFLLFAPWIALGGLKAIWWFSAFWGALTSLATGMLGGLCWGRKHGPTIAVLHAAGAAVAADGDINYSFWMTLPFVLAAAFSLRGAESRRVLPIFGNWFMAGMLGCFAVLIRPSAATIVLVYAAVLLPALIRGEWRRVFLSGSGGVFGAMVITGLILLPFVRNGSLAAMLDGYATVKRYADESVTSIIVGAGGRVPATLNGLQCLPNQLPVYHLLLAFALIPVPWATRGVSGRPWGYVSWIFVLASFAGISLTLRFFTHDNAPIWPALAIVVMRPGSLLGVGVARFTRHAYQELSLSFGLGLLATLSGWQTLNWLQNYMHDSDAKVAKLCERLGPHMGETDTVLAWGWSAWGVYEHCGRWAPGPVYKDLTNVTTPNTNTCNRGYEPPRLKRGPLAERYLSDLMARRPALIVVSDYYKGLGGEPLDEWHEARMFIRENYVDYDTTEGFRALLRRDLAPEVGVLPDESPAFHVPSGSTVMNACGAEDGSWQSLTRSGDREL